MKSGPRCTRFLPTIEMIENYKNWKFAIDEETRPGQDETTLKPCYNQKTIHDEVDYTVGVAVTNQGKEYWALLGIHGEDIRRVNIMADNGCWASWSLTKTYSSSWKIDFENDKSSIDYKDEIFPLHVSSSIQRKGKPELETKILKVFH